jgi:hypothetical protein
MSEWQPARYRKVHTRPEGLVTRSTAPPSRTLNGQIIFVRPTENANVALFRACGCDAEKFYEIQGYRYAGVCEHEILTD